MKVVCRIPWSMERDAGWMLMPGESEQDGKKRLARESVKLHPNIRPCGRYHGWVTKAQCPECPDCVRAEE